jgi:hypothetical protein
MVCAQTAAVVSGREVHHMSLNSFAEELRSLTQDEDQQKLRCGIGFCGI